MPQMAPMNWLLLCIMFIFVFLIFNSMNYFSFYYNYSKSTKPSNVTYNTTWKW